MDTENAKPDRWYFKTYILVIAFLCVGPLMLPLVWYNPRFTAVKKTVVSVLIIGLTVILAVSMINSIRTIITSYQQFLQ